MIKKVFCFLLVFLFSLTVPVPAWAAASLSLSPASGAKTVNTTFTVDIILDTGGDDVTGVSAIITYDTAKLSVNGSAITPGSILADTPLKNTVDSSAGKIQYDSGSLTTAYHGRGTLATISFKPIAEGTANVNFTFNPSATLDTSLVAAAQGTNLLTTVNNGVYTIGASGSTSTSTSLPPTGVVENTIATLVGGVLFFGIGLLLARRSFLIRG